MKKHYLIIFTLLLIGCSRSDFTKTIPVESRIVVEGNIEEGKFAEVILMRSIPINAVIDSSTVLNQVIRSAKVTVSDGIQEEVLRLKINPGTIPPFIYYGSSIMGETGKTYTLKVTYLDKTIESTTSIPKTISITSASYQKKNIQENKGYIFLKFEDPKNEKNYYHIATQLKKQDSIFIPALYGNLDDNNFESSLVSLQINRGISLYPKTKFQPYFEDGNIIVVKLRTMNKQAFDFWNSWQNEIVNGQNPIFPSNTSLKTNIKGGLGIWAGYGQDIIIVNTNTVP